MTQRRRRAPALFLFFASASIAAFVGCAKQGEGDRCDYTNNGNDDCDSALVCVPETALQQKGADRCCPPDNQPSSVPSCQRAGTIGTGGTGGTGGAAGSGGSTGGTGGTGGSTGGTGGSTGGTGGTGGSTGGTGGTGGSTGGAGGTSDAGTG